MNEELLTIKQASDELGVPIWVVRRLCRNGMVPHVRRNRSRYQVFGPEQIGIMRMLIDLEKAGMSRNNLKRLAWLMRQGDATLAEQKAMLETQKRQFWQDIEDLQRGIDIIERKIEVIDQSTH